MNPFREGAMTQERREGPFEQLGEAVGEAQVERAWEKVGRESHGDWSRVRDQVSFGYTYREPGAPNPS